MRRRSAAAALAVALLLGATPATAQVEGVFAAVLVEPELFPVPIVRFQRIGMDDQVWIMSVNGLMIGLEHQRPVRPKARLILSAEVTPARANASDRIYVQGERVESAEYENGLLDLRLGFNYDRSDRWTTAVRLIALTNRVDDLPPEIEQFWRSPHAGVSIAQVYERQTARDPFRGTFEGMGARAHVEVFVGEKTKTWSRATLAGEHSRRIGNVRFTESATLFYSESLNLVNRFLVGSSWRVPGIHPLYGFRYAEFRLDKGAAINGAVDYRLTDRIDLGIRLSYLTGSSDDQGVRAQGVALELGTTMRGVGITLGAGVPRQRNAVENEPTFYAMIGTSVFVKLSRFGM